LTLEKPKAEKIISKRLFYAKAINYMEDDRYKIRDKLGVNYVTFAVVQQVDVFSRKTYVDISLSRQENYYLQYLNVSYNLA
jgi:hypothetical protein